MSVTVLFAQEIYFPFQSTARLSAYLKSKGHAVRLIIGDEKKVAAAAREIKPDIIAFSVLTPYRNHMLSCVSALKKAGVRSLLIAGGYDITFLPEILEHSGLDAVCRGEGEEPLAELCDRLAAGKDYSDIPNLWVKKDGRIIKNPMRIWASDLDALPFDDRDLYLDYDDYFKIIPFTQVLAGRGCPYLCSYCFNHGYRKIYEAEGSTGYCKLRSVENVIAELRILKEKYGARYIFFNDSTLAYNKRWFLQFLEAYRKEIKLPLSVNAVVREIDDDIARALKECGYCALVRLALETGNEEYRLKVLKKNITNQQMLEGTGFLRKHGVRYSMAMMFGLPGETVDLAWETIELAAKMSAKDSVHAVNIFKPFPGLDITEYGVSIGQYRAQDVSAHAVPDALKARSGADPSGYKDAALGDRDMCFYQNYRVDPEGQRLLCLSRFSHAAIRVPFLRPLIRRLINYPDNAFYRFVWWFTEAWLNIRVHAGAPWSFFLKYYLFHSHKKIR
ncbi:MAG: radical SAM protein [Elusimicrobiota bacterium]